MTTTDPDWEYEDDDPSVGIFGKSWTHVPCWNEGALDPSDDPAVVWDDKWYETDVRYEGSEVNHYRKSIVHARDPEYPEDDTYEGPDTLSQRRKEWHD